jgi:hypothetical protein
MMQETGMPAGQRSFSLTFRLALLAAVFAVCPAVGAASPDPPRATTDAALDRSLEMISKAFHTERPDPLAALVPSDGKAFLSLEAVGGGAGYYSRDQVYFIFSRVFSQQDTVKFFLRKLKTGDPGQDFVFCIGTWSYHRHDGEDNQTQIHFVLSMRKGAWSLVEIREAQ